MSEIKIIQGHNEQRIESGSGTDLLQIIRSHGFELIAPCGGNGTCGKCRVKIKDEDFVTACVYYPDHNIEVILPDKRESQILTTQYENSVNLPFIPGSESMYVSYPLGVAIDIGTTTVVFYLMSLITGSILHVKGVMNPQAKYGADVISRIQHCSEPGGLHELRDEIIRLINRELKIFALKSNVEMDQFVKLTISGNTTMLHLLLGVDPTSMALAPFTPTFTVEKKLNAREYGIEINDRAEVHLLPSISAYVGADIVAGLASLSPPEKIKNYLFIDIGTNGEMALVSPDKIYCCATAAGPAFEGANISCGMGAFTGAIATFTNKNSYSTIDNAPPAGICGSGLIDIVAWLVREKLLSQDGVLETDFIILEAGKYQTLVSLNQQDIREIQLAKAAIIAGIQILVKTAKLRFNEIDALFLAGGFGNYLRVENAIEIGLLPEEMRNKIIPIGNSSGTGATLALKSQQFGKNLGRILERTKYIELSSHEDFVLEYALHMNFPDQQQDL